VWFGLEETLEDCLVRQMPAVTGTSSIRSDYSELLSVPTKVPASLVLTKPIQFCLVFVSSCTVASIALVTSITPFHSAHWGWTVLLLKHDAGGSTSTPIGDWRTTAPAAPALPRFQASLLDSQVPYAWAVKALTNLPGFLQGFRSARWDDALAWYLLKQGSAVKACYLEWSKLEAYQLWSGNMQIKACKIMVGLDCSDLRLLYFSMETFTLNLMYIRFYLLSL